MAASYDRGIHEEGWYRDPYQQHEDRWFSDGKATSLVRDHGATSRDEPPPHDPPEPLVPVPENELGNPDDTLRADELSQRGQSVGRQAHLRNIADIWA